MTNRTLTTIQEAAALLLDALATGQEVTLDVTSADATNGGLLRLIAAIHDAATARRLGVVVTATGERSIRLELADP